MIKKRLECVWFWCYFICDFTKWEKSLLKLKAAVWNIKKKDNNNNKINNTSNNNNNYSNNNNDKIKIEQQINRR